MRGCMRHVFDRVFEELLQPLTEHDDCPSDIFSQVYAAISPHLVETDPDKTETRQGAVSVPRDELVAQAGADPAKAEDLVSKLSEADFGSEPAIISAMSAVHEILCEIEDSLADAYLERLREFVARYSLRYYVDAEANFWVSLSGVATSLFAQIRRIAQQDSHILTCFIDFERALAQCISDPVETHIKTTIQKQCNFLEAVGAGPESGSGSSLGRIIDEARTWPDERLKEATKILYQFASDYPGIRHGGSKKVAIRKLDMRDLISITLSLAGAVTHLTNGFENEVGDIMLGEPPFPDLASNATAPWQSVLT